MMLVVLLTSGTVVDDGDAAVVDGNVAVVDCVTRQRGSTKLLAVEMKHKGTVTTVSQFFPGVSSALVWSGVCTQRC